MNQLYYGDNLDILREHIRDESVDLIYLDPPFNSKASYNVLFKTPDGHESDAQITAFEDNWHWGNQAEEEFDQLLHQPNTAVSEMTLAMRRFLRENDMMAYLVMMANRLLELHRVLKPTGSLYLHCDPTASHYLKVLLDAVFGPTNFRTEIVWKRSSAHSDAKQGRAQHGRIHDVILFYTKTDDWYWHQIYTPYSPDYVDAFYKYKEPGTGRIYRLDNLTGPGGASKGNPAYEVMGVTRYWRYSQEKMEQLVREGRVVQTKPGTVPAYKRYLDEMPGVPLQDWWDDIGPIHSQSKERLGYPTQKPLDLLQRIVGSSCPENGVVLDPFCGCGTTVTAAQTMGRPWIGIDITHLAISLIEKRLRNAFPEIVFEVHGTPKDLDGARDLATRDKYQFQWWACSLVDARPYQGKKKGADSGVDGLIFFQDDKSGAKKIVVSVKGGESVHVGMIRDLKGVREREKAEIGLFVTLTQPSKQMKTEAASAGLYQPPLFPGKSYPRIQILTIEGLLNGSERPEYPDMAMGVLTFPKTPEEPKKTAQKKLFG